MAAQWDEGGWQSIDWGQAVTAGALGAVAGVVTAGIGSGVISALLTRFPGACTVITMSMRGLSLGSGAFGLYQGAVAISEGRYASGAMSILGGVLSVYGAFKVKFCFVAGTQVLVQADPPWFCTVVGIAIGGRQALDRSKRRRQDAARAIDIVLGTSEEDDSPEDVDPEVLPLPEPFAGEYERAHDQFFEAK